jgi:Fe-S-cluster containining protein
MQTILQNYATLLASVDAWFARCMAAYPAEIACRSGCSECCRGQFDITLLDACYLKSGFDRIDAVTRQAVLAKAGQRILSLQALWPEFTLPYILNYRPDEEWEELMPEEDETPCPLLGVDGSCLVYAYRPMTCRLNGVPLIDVSGEEFFDEWCTLNFTGEEPLGRKELRWEFNRLFRDELRQFRRFTEMLLGFPVSELDTFIPTALLIDFAGFDWRSWGEKARFMKKPA